MSEQLQTLQYYQAMDVRMLVIKGQPWFVGKDVAVALGYTNPRKALADHVDDEDKGVTKCYTPGGEQEMTIINESGLYSLILSSKLPSAKAFKRWVTNEVLPSIRMTGSYSVGPVKQAGAPTALPSIAKLSHGATAQHLWLALLELDRMQDGTGLVRISNSDLTRLLGLRSRHTIMNARKELIAAGLLEFTPGTKANPSTYRLKGK